MVADAGITIDGVSFGIGSFRMEGLSFDVARGEYFVLTGANGSGKTVLMRLIAGLYRPASGAIRIHGHDLADVPPWERGVGVVPQEGVLFPNRTVEGNIAFGLEVRGRSVKDQAMAVRRVADLVGVGHLLERMPQGLSGGERQKVSIARALAFEPQVLLLDEPVSSIDETARDSLCRELRRIQDAMALTTIHVSHNRVETELVADRVGVLESGRLKAISSVNRDQKPA